MSEPIVPSNLPSSTSSELRQDSVTSQLASLDLNAEVLGPQSREVIDEPRHEGAPDSTVVQHGQEIPSPPKQTEGASCAPVLKLPDELLAGIFKVGNRTPPAHDTQVLRQDGDQEDEDLAGFDEKAFPMAVSQVNRRFRAVAIGTPDLWSHITMKDFPPYPLTKLWLSRAHLIDIDLDLRSVMADGIEEALTTLLPTTRWRSFKALISSYDDVQRSLCAIADPAPELQVLKLMDVGNMFYEDDSLPAIADVFGGVAPKLRDLSLWTVPMKWSSPMLSGLRSVELAYLPKAWRLGWREWVDIIRASPDLHRLVLIAAGPHLLEESDPSNYPQVNQITLDNLEILELGGLQPWVLSRVIQTLHAPNLLHLALDTLDDWDYSNEVNLVSESRYPRLRRLAFVNVSVDDDEFLDLLRRMPKLEELELDSADGLLEALLEDSSCESENPCFDSAISPELHVLRTVGYGPAQLAAFVEKRRQIGHPMLSLFVSKADKELMANQTDLDFSVQKLHFGYFEERVRKQVAQPDEPDDLYSDTPFGHFESEEEMEEFYSMMVDAGWSG